MCAPYMAVNLLDGESFEGSGERTMFKALVDFWQDDTGIERPTTLLVEIILGTAAAALIFTTIYVGLRNLAVKTKGTIENASP